jgi:hypothetical protein
VKPYELERLARRCGSRSLGLARDVVIVLVASVMFMKLALPWTPGWFGTGVLIGVACLIGLLAGWMVCFTVGERAWYATYIRKRDGLCIHCGYDVRVNAHRCPECGGVPFEEPLR